MNLLQKMGVFGSKANIAAHSLKLYSIRKKLVNELQSVFSEKSGIDFGEGKLYNEIPEITDSCVAVSYNFYLNNSYHKISALFKKYKNAMEDWLLGAGRKFAKKTDKRIDKANLQKDAEDVKLLEEEKEIFGGLITELMDDYEYYLKAFEKLNTYFGIKQDESLKLD